METININGKDYVEKSKVQSYEYGEDQEIKREWFIVRTYSAGVFFAKIKSRDGKEATLLNSRRIWYWSGAASLSQLATEGTKNPEECKFPCPMIEHDLTEVIEVIPCTEMAIRSINEVPIWEE